MRPVRVLWVGDAVTPTGFARVTHGVVDRLHLAGYHVGILGLAYDGEPHQYPYPVWKASQASLGPDDDGAQFGFNILTQAIKQMRADIVVLFHDPWVVAEYLKIIRGMAPVEQPKVVVYSPVDGEGQLPKTISHLEQADQVCAYTEFGADQFRKAGFTKDIVVVPHGVELSTFRKMDKSAARYLTGIAQKKWVVLNANRNQPRKRIDLTIKGFVKFAAHVKDKGGPVPLLHLHMLPLDAGWDVIALMQRECMKYGVDMVETFSMTNYQKMPVSDQDLNALYNAIDLGINTSLGEGWGLPAFEMASLGIPQMMTDYAAGGELFRGKAWMLPVTQRVSALKTCVEGGLTSEGHVAETLLAAYTNPAASQGFAQKALEMVRDGRYRWEVIGRQFHEIFKKLAPNQDQVAS